MNATPCYVVVAESGPDHSKRFEVVAMVGNTRYGTGRGPTKKAAEQTAAAQTLAMLGQAPSCKCDTCLAPEDPQ